MTKTKKIYSTVHRHTAVPSSASGYFRALFFFVKHETRRYPSLDASYPPLYSPVLFLFVLTFGSDLVRGLGNDLMRLRLSILYQSAATARGHENEEGEIDPVDAVDWTVMFEGKDRAGTGKATTDDLHAVFKEVR